MTFPGHTHLSVDQKVDEIFTDNAGMDINHGKRTDTPIAIYIYIYILPASKRLRHNKITIYYHVVAPPICFRIVYRKTDLQITHTNGIFSAEIQKK